MLFSVTTEFEFNQLKDAMSCYIPSDALLDKAKDAMRQQRNVGMGDTVMTEEKAQMLVSKCGPRNVEPHSVNALYLDLCVNNIDILTEDSTFFLDMWVQMVWEDGSFEGRNVYDEDDLARLIRMEPEIEFLNQVSETEKSLYPEFILIKGYSMEWACWCR